MRILSKTITSSVTGVSSTMDVNKKIDVDLDFNFRSVFNGILRGLWIRVSGAASSPTAITIRLSEDTAGDKIIIPDTDSSIAFGLTTTSSGAAFYSIDMGYVSSEAEKLYLFLNTDTGTVNVDSVTLTYEVAS